MTPLVAEGREIKVAQMRDTLLSLNDLTLSGSVIAPFPKVISPEGEVRWGVWLRNGCINMGFVRMLEVSAGLHFTKLHTCANCGYIIQAGGSQKRAEGPSSSYRTWILFKVNLPLSWPAGSTAPRLFRAVLRFFQHLKVNDL